MLAALALASGLWLAASEAGARADAQVAVVVPVERIADDIAMDLALNGVGTGLDLMSTDWAINRGCVEANPLAPRVEGRVALKVGAAAVRGSVAYWLRRTGHKKAADVWRWTALAVDSLLTVNNIRCGVRS